jgi:two-component system chemotaxis response regulator CheY
MRTIINRSLTAVGVEEIVEARDGEEGLKLFKSSAFSLVLTDYNMPNKNGLELIKDLRALETEVPIIMITTEAERATIIEAIQAGVSDYLIKPFDSCLLKKKLERLWAE